MAAAVLPKKRLAGRLVRVAVLIYAPSENAARIVAGLGSYVRSEWGGRWRLDVLMRDGASGRRDPLAGWSGDGAIVVGSGPVPATASWSATLPVVFVGGGAASGQQLLVHADDHAAARIAAEHLADAGIAHMALCGPKSPATATLLGDLGGDRGSRLTVFEHPATGSPANARHRLGEWVAGLPKPIGIVAVSNVVASELVAACHARGIDVPGDVAIVGIGIDESICDAMQPQLTRVVQNLEAMGKEAATLLARVLAGGSSGGDRIAVPPRGLVIRGSSETTAVTDPLLRKAVHLVRRRACEERLTSEDVAESLGISRRSLDRLSAQHLGRSIRDEIHRCRLAEARFLLLTTDQKLLAVAVRTGFASAAHLCTAFKAAFGVTPGQFRRGTARS